MVNIPADPVYTIIDGVYRTDFPDTSRIEFVRPQSITIES